MSQHDMNIANGSGATVRADINNALVALVGIASGTTAPSTTFSYMLWADTTNGLLKQRNAANTGWLIRGTLAESFVSAKSSAYTVVVTDFGKWFNATSSFTLGLTAAATLGDGFMFGVRNDGSGAITIDPNSTELIDGASTIVLAPGESCIVVCDGSGFKTFGRAGSVKQPTRTVKTSGSGTYTTPAGATRLLVRMVGGGGGGGATGTSGATNGGAGGNTTFSTLTASGGAGGGLGNAGGTGVGGSGGAASGGDVNIPGGSGGTGTGNIGANATGGGGGNSAFGGASGATSYPNSGASATTNSGSGSSGTSGNGSVFGAAGGGAGGYVEKLITSPAASYSYAVGAGGTGGTAGASGGSGGAGAAGLIIIDEYYD